MSTIIESKKQTKARSGKITGGLKDSAGVFGELRAILLIPRKQRNVAHLQQLAALTKNVKVFSELTQELSSDSYLQCCQCLNYVRFPAGQFVFHEGDYADNFYLILKGSVGVLVREEKLVSTSTKLVSVLREGECFGELALISSQPRLASILTRQESHLAVLNREDYNRILAKAHERVIAQKMEVLVQQPLFKRMSRGALTRMSYFFKIRKMKRKQIVFATGQIANELFLVKEGEFQLTKSIGFDPPVSTSQRLSRSFHCSIDVTLLGVGELIGSSELLSGEPYAYTCMCYSTTGEILSVTKKDFLETISNEDMISYLTELNEKKEEYWKQRVDTVTQVEREKRTTLNALGMSPLSPKFISHSKTLSEPTQFPANQSVHSTIDHSRTLSGLRLSLETNRNCNKSMSTLEKMRRSAASTSKLNSWSDVFCRKYSLNSKSTKTASRGKLIVNFHTHSLKTMRLRKIQGVLQNRERSEHAVVTLGDYSHLRFLD